MTRKGEHTMNADESIDKILSQIDPQEVIRLTAELVRINSVWDPENGTCEKPAAEHAARWAEARGFPVQVDEVRPGRPNVVVTFEAAPGERTLMFEGHTDVVTPGDVSAWTHDPFGAEIVGRRMYGRGANDTKGNLAAMLVAMSALKRSGVPLKGSIVGGVLCDEEDQMLGVLDFIEKGHADAVTAAVICEPEDGLICNAQKGAIRARFDITGRMSHGAMPLAGLNTAPAVARIIDGLQRLEQDAVEKAGMDPLLGWPSFTPTVIQAPAAGPAQLNVVPGSSRILVDIRTVPAQSHDDIRQAVERLAREAADRTREAYEAYDRTIQADRDPNIKVEVRFITDRPCTFTDENEPVVRAADWAVRKVTGAEPEYGGVPGATDGTFLWACKNIPIVTMGAGDRRVPHQVDEWVDLDQLVDTARIYALTAWKYLTPENDAS